MRLYSFDDGTKAKGRSIFGWFSRVRPLMILEQVKSGWLGGDRTGHCPGESSPEMGLVWNKSTMVVINVKILNIFLLKSVFDVISKQDPMV